MEGFPVKVLGRLLGWATDFNPIGAEHVQYGGFKPAPGVDLKPGALEIEFDSGMFNIYEEVDGVEHPYQYGDIFPIVVSLPRVH